VSGPTVSSQHHFDVALSVEFASAPGGPRRLPTSSGLTRPLTCFGSRNKIVVTNARLLSRMAHLAGQSWSNAAGAPEGGSLDRAKVGDRSVDPVVHKVADVVGLPTGTRMKLSMRSAHPKPIRNEQPRGVAQQGDKPQALPEISRIQPRRPRPLRSDARGRSPLLLRWSRGARAVRVDPLPDKGETIVFGNSVFANDVDAAATERHPPATATECYRPSFAAIDAQRRR
jgi:hypothetical protein